MAFDAQDNATDYRFLEVSPFFEAHTGIEDAAGRWMRDIAPDQDPFWFEAYGRVALTGEPARFEAGSGPLGRWWSVYGYRLGDPAERTIAVLFSDISERKRAEAALAESEERFRSFAENSADTLWIVDAELKRLEYLSPAFEAMWGETRERITADLGHWAGLVHPDDRGRAAEGMPRLLAGEMYEQTYRIVRPSDGAVRFIQDTGFPIRDEGGRVRRVAGIAKDVTDARQAANKIRKSERRLRALVEGIPQLVWRAGGRGRMDLVEPAVERVHRAFAG